MRLLGLFFCGLLLLLLLLLGYMHESVVIVKAWAICFR